MNLIQGVLVMAVLLPSLHAFLLPNEGMDWMKKILSKIFFCRHCKEAARKKENRIKCEEIFNNINESERKLKLTLDDAQLEMLEEFTQALESYYVELHNDAFLHHSPRIGEIMKWSIRNFVVNHVFSRKF